MKKEEFDIEEMSEETGISTAVIKEALNIPLETNCTAKTIFEAQKDFRNAIPDSENKLGAFKVWLSLITTTSDARKTYKSVPKDSIYESLAYEKWHMLSLKELSKIANMADAKKVYKNSPPRSSAKSLALNRWNQFSLVEVSKIEFLADAKKVYKNAHPLSKAKLLAFKKIIELTESVLELRRMYKKLPENSKVRYLVFRKWYIVSLKEVISASNLEEAKIAYDNAPVNSDVRKFAIDKMATYFGFDPN
ncbi:MAG: hypothetical protein JJE53_02355 [Candidatus Pacebacteria bacterium]|nr:hypothetical protein [Candidatus Paceibacterota bacterium]